MKTWMVLFALAAFSIRLGAQSIFDSLYTVRTAEFYFSSGSSEIWPEHRPLLDSLMRCFKTRPDAVQLRIIAHTDAQGDAQGNFALAKLRAQSLRNLMEGAGIPGGAIMEVPAGENHPVASNDSELGRQQNRRATVELRIRVPMATYTGKVQDEETGKGLAAIVYFRSRTRHDSTATDSGGNFVVRLPKDTIVKIEAIAKGYFFAATTLRIYSNRDLYERYKISTSLSLPQARRGQKAVIRDLIFVESEAMLVKTSEDELPKVVKFLQFNPELQVEIAGHINNPGRRPGDIPEWEWALSANRAKTVYDYLIKAGISPHRLTYKGYGNTEMIFRGCQVTEEQQKQNRRVEIRIL